MSASERRAKSFEDKPRARANRPRRLNPRFPIAQSVDVRTAEGLHLSYFARDLSRGGLFLNTTQPLPIFSEVDVLLQSAEGEPCAVPARVVHIVSQAKAALVGSSAGMGLQLEPTSRKQEALIDELVENAQKHDPRRRIPRVIPGADRAIPSGDPMLGYVLDLIDGVRTPEKLAAALGIDPHAIEELLNELLGFGIIELCTGATPTVQPPPTVHTKATVPAPAAVNASLPAELRALLDAFLDGIEGIDHYGVLGIASKASRQEIWDAFVAVGKTFHPDQYIGVATRDELELLERAISRVNEAYGVLSRSSSRAEYDAYLSRARGLQAAMPGSDAEPVRKISVPLPAAELEKQARYEEEHQMWSEAAQSWLRVCDARPSDPISHRRAALAVLSSEGDLRRAVELAKRAVELAPDDWQNRRVLGHAYLAAGMKQKARQEIEAAVRLGQGGRTGDAVIHLHPAR